MGIWATFTDVLSPDIQARSGILEKDALLRVEREQREAEILSLSRAVPDDCAATGTVNA